MKISTNLLFDRGASQMSNVQTQLTQSQAQLAQGKQIINASDAPNQAASIQRLKSILSRQESYQSSLDTIKARLQGEDSTLQNVSDLLVRAKEIAVQGGNDTLNAGDRKALATEMQALRDQMLSLANTKDSNGNYLFAGSRVKQPAFVETVNGSPEYRGDQTRMNVRVGEQRSIPVNRTGTDAFVPVSRVDADGKVSGIGFFQVMDNLIAGLNTSKGPDIRRGVGELDDLMQGLSMARANIGTNLNVVDQQSSVIEDTTLNLKTTLSSIEDLDYASAITKMNQQMMSLEAAQSSFAKVSQLNLFNFIK
ncbi:flagellar hook-associated protein FlgL [Limnohabitans sp. Hippo4]|uniref:flagellar hook-associated protein FlgL n=1 Tax=Limnohabitans sp. Hippo4 TaxID=1826167 RepID=UPI000D334528|nr:flagellar hook-associated protein FlgL [Limnohabitans sp. Hippo4]PUE35471.1 flagellar hook-associated protein 3 [Limnohabitans sp. Hippo4]